MPSLFLSLLSSTHFDSVSGQRERDKERSRRLNHLKVNHRLTDRRTTKQKSPEDRKSREYDAFREGVASKKYVNTLFFHDAPRPKMSEQSVKRELCADKERKRCLTYSSTDHQMPFVLNEENMEFSTLARSIHVSKALMLPKLR